MRRLPGRIISLHGIQDSLVVGIGLLHQSGDVNIRGVGADGLQDTVQDGIHGLGVAGLLVRSAPSSLEKS